MGETTGQGRTRLDPHVQQKAEFYMRQNLSGRAFEIRADNPELCVDARSNAGNLAAACTCWPEASRPAAAT